MSKFCQNCGNMLDDNAAFCDKCGKPFETPDVQPAAPQYEEPAAPQYEESAAPQYEAPAAPQYGDPQQYGQVAVAEKKNPLQAVLAFIKAKKILVIGCAILLVLVIVLISIFSSCASNSAAGTLNKAFDYAKTLDVKGILNVNYEVQFDKEATDESIKEQAEKAQAQLDENKQMADMLKSMIKDAKLKVTKDEKLDQEKVDSLKSEWSSDYRDTDKISEIHELTYELDSALMSGGGAQSCYAVKVGGKWYIKGMESLAISGI